MDYLELTIHFKQFEPDFTDILIAELSEYPFESFSEEEQTLKAFIPVQMYEPHWIETIQQQYPGIPFEFSTHTIKTENWNQTWENNFSPVLITNQCIIRAPFHDKPTDVTFDIVIEPKMSFGTGHHATTALMVEYILELDCAEKTVLDMGCGTGVLGILAGMKKASHIDLIDNDEWAYHNTVENCERNNIKNTNKALGGIEKIPENAQYHIILANINRNILLEQIPVYTKHLKPDGILLLSGILTSDFETINQKCINSGLKWISKKQKNNWLSLQYKA